MGLVKLNIYFPFFLNLEWIESKISVCSTKHLVLATYLWRKIKFLHPRLLLKYSLLFVTR